MARKPKKTKQLFMAVPGRVQDLQAIQYIQNTCFPDDQKSLRWFMQRLGPDESQYMCYAAKIVNTDTVVGYLLAKANGKGDAEILSVGVSVMYRRLGIGRLLLSQFLDESRGIVVGVYAHVPDRNDYLTAQLFLRDCGFPDSRIDRKKETVRFERYLV